MRNIEVLRNYFFGKDPQLKETLADNSLRLIGIEGKHFVLRTELIKRIQELKNYVDKNDKELQDAIDTLSETLEREIERVENKYNITQDTRLYELANGVYRVVEPEVKLYYNQTQSLVNDDDLILVKEAKSFFIFSTVPSTDHPSITYGIADAATGWRSVIKLEELEQTTNKKDTVTQSSTDYPSGLAVYNALLNYYTKAEVNDLISVIPRFDIEVVETLPTEDISETTIYLAPSADPQAENAYDEFIYVSNEWEQIGSTAIDLSDYYTKEEVNAKTFINRLTQDITIPVNAELNPLLLSTGWWYTGEHVIYYGESVEPTIHNNDLFYFNAEAGDQWFYFLPPNLEDGWNQLGTYLWFDNTDHIWQYSGYGVITTINDQSTDSQIPTAGAVYAQLLLKQNTLPAGSTISVLPTGFSRIWDLDVGVYKCVPGIKLYYNGATDTQDTIDIEEEDSQQNTKAWDGMLIVTSDNDSRGENYITKYWYLFSDTNEILYGSTTKTSGSYEEAQLDNIQPKLTAGSNVSITGNVIAATDTTYSAFTGTDGQTAGTAGLVPAPATTDNGKFLCADGTWQTSGGGGTTITYGTTDLTPGVSPLNDGEFYFQFE